MKTVSKEILEKHTPKTLTPVTKAQIERWITPPGDYCFNCDTHGSRAAEQKGNLEVRTCNTCDTVQSYTTK